MLTALALHSLRRCRGCWQVLKARPPAPKERGELIKQHLLHPGGSAAAAATAASNAAGARVVGMTMQGCWSAVLCLANGKAGQGAGLSLRPWSTRLPVLPTLLSVVDANFPCAALQRPRWGSCQQLAGRRRRGWCRAPRRTLAGAARGQVRAPDPVPPIISRCMAVQVLHFFTSNKDQEWCLRMAMRWHEYALYMAWRVSRTSQGCGLTQGAGEQGLAGGAPAAQALR